MSSRRLSLEALEDRLLCDTTPLLSSELQWGNQRLATETALTLPGTEGQRTTAIATSPTSNLLVRGMATGTAQIYDAANGQLLTSFQAVNGNVWQMEFSPDGSKLAVSGQPGTLKIYDTQTWQVTAQCALPAFNYSMSFTDDGQFIALSIIVDQPTYIVSVADGSMRVIPGKYEFVEVMGNSLLTADHESRTVSIVSMADGSVQWSQNMQALPIAATASTQANMFAIGLQGGGVLLFDATTRQEIARTKMNNDAYKMTFDGYLLSVKGYTDGLGVVDVRNLQPGQPLTFDWHTPFMDAHGYDTSLPFDSTRSVVFDILDNGGIRAFKLPDPAPDPSVIDAVFSGGAPFVSNDDDEESPSPTPSIDSPLLGGNLVGDNQRHILLLPTIGGSASFSAVRGPLATEPGINTLSGEEASQAIGNIDAQNGSSIALAPALGLHNTQAALTNQQLFTVPEFGRISIHAGGGSLVMRSDALVAGTAVIQNNGSTNFYDVGAGYVFIEFLDGPQYVSQVQVTHLNTMGTGYVSFTDAEGNYHRLSIDDSGWIRIDKEIIAVTLVPLQGGAYGIQSIDTRPIVAESSWADLETVLQVQGNASVLDFSSAEHTVTAVTLQVGSGDPTDVITAHVYHGEQEVQTVEVPRDDTFTLDHIDGISSIVFTHTKSASPFFIGELAIATNGAVREAPWEQADNSNNAALSMATAPLWESGVPYNYLELQTNIIYLSGGETLSTSNSGKTVGVANPDPTAYQRLEVHTMDGGSMQIMDIFYLNETGMHKLPTDRYELVAPGVAILYPGSPVQLAISLLGTGTFGMPSFVESGATAAEVMPSYGPQISSTFVQWLTQPGEEGWTTVPGEATSRAIYGPNAALFEVRNDGLHAASVTVTIRVGTTGTSADQAVRSFTGTIPAMSSKALRVNVTPGEGETVSIEVMQPDGTSFSSVRKTSTNPTSMTRVVDPETGMLVWHYGEEPLADQAAAEQVYGSPASLADMHTLWIILHSDGIGTPEERAAAYIASNPGSEVAYMALTGQTLNSPDLHIENVAFVANPEMNTHSLLASPVIDLGSYGIGKELTGQRTLFFSEKGSIGLQFTLTENKMVNFWVPGVADRDVTLRITGGPLPSEGYTSKRTRSSGQSISLQLTPGTYRITLVDVTGYETTSLASGNFSAELNFSTARFDSANLHGVVSLEGNNQAMPVSMRVAAFDANGKRVERDPITQESLRLDPNKPVWVVVHGMEDSERGGTERVARELTKYQGTQVVTINWEKAAESLL